ncbi:signal-regulatory protein beta-2-like isoform X2 [Polypterus senegalus]|uniref:signal-regulatory protein beta-2-like isoform X2 n=1 Tax=Polypterus senegalus TaxID=55291 RepID=UPI001965CEBF|nr:signal-regulatory protein beta-2-like isoform X2 [Polypterus senegalus]
MADHTTMQLLTFGLLVLCLHASSISLTSLPGHTVSLNCTDATSSVGSPRLWYRQLPRGPPQPILQIFSPNHTSHFSYFKFGGHFLVNKSYTLVIQNVTQEDAATYYCSQLEKDVCRFSDGIELRVDGSMEVNGTPEGAAGLSCHCRILIWVSAILGFLLLVMTSALTYAVCRPKSKVRRLSKQMESDQKSRRRCFDSEISSTKKELEGEYEMLSHKDQALYEVCQHSQQTARK